MNGTANVTSVENSWDNHKAASGTINITAAGIAGTGSLKADGFPSGSSSKLSGGGGRIAIRLTGKDATFDNFPLANITADGAIRNNDVRSMSSAGTIYLQSGNEVEGAGTILVKSANSAITYPTPIPSLKYGGENDVLKSAKLSVEKYGRVWLADSVRMARVTIDNTAKLDLNGKILTVGSATLAGSRLPLGVYTADSEKVSGRVSDSVGGGQLVVSGNGLVIGVR